LSNCGIPLTGMEWSGHTRNPRCRIIVWQNTCPLFTIGRIGRGGSIDKCPTVHSVANWWIRHIYSMTSRLHHRDMRDGFEKA